MQEAQKAAAAAAKQREEEERQKATEAARQAEEKAASQREMEEKQAKDRAELEVPFLTYCCLRQHTQLLDQVSSSMKSILGVASLQWRSSQRPGLLLSILSCIKSIAG